MVRRQKDTYKRVIQKRPPGTSHLEANDPLRAFHALSIYMTLIDRFDFELFYTIFDIIRCMSYPL